MKRFKFNEKHMKSNLKKASAIVASVFMGLSAVSVGLSTASAEDTPETETPSLTENVASNESTTITDGKTTYTAIEETRDTQEASEAEQTPETIQPSENVQNTGSDKVRLVYEGKKKNVDESEVSAQYGSMYVLEYDSQEEANEAENRLKGKGSKIDTEQVLSIDDETSTGDVVETEQIDTAINHANEKSVKDYSGQNVIALIDTGSDGTALDAVSFVDGEAVDNNGHATRMAKAIRKQDKNAKILALKALDDNGNGTTSSVVAAIQYAIDSHVSIINLSLSGLANENSSLITAKVKEAIKAGITVVFDNILELDQTNTNDFDCIYQNYTWFVDNGVQLTFDRSPNCDYSKVKSNCDKFLDDKIEITFFDMFRLILKMEVEAYINIKTAQVTRKRNAQLSACRVTGKSYGRPKGSKSESEKAKNAMNVIFENSRMFNGELTDGECIALAGVSRTSYYRYKQALMNKLIKAEL